MNDASKAAEAMGAKVHAKGVLEAVVDEENRLVTTPAYMCEASAWEVFQGIGKMVDAVAALASKTTAAA